MYNMIVKLGGILNGVMHNIEKGRQYDWFKNPH